MGILSGTKVLEERQSKFNGKVEVIKSLAWGTYIQVEGLTQSGGVVEGIWRSTLRKIRSTKSEIRNALILGLGGGTVAKLVDKLWPNVEITGVDIDPVMVELGTKHLGLDNNKVEIVIADALTYSKQLAISGKQFDLIIIDIYKGREYPEKFSEEKFTKLIKKLLTKDGIAVFNRLYYSEKRLDTMRFGRSLEKVFSKVEYFYPQANIMFISSNSKKQGSY